MGPQSEMRRLPRCHHRLVMRAGLDFQEAAQPVMVHAAALPLLLASHLLGD